MATFTPVNELERLLASAAADPAGRPAFFRALTEHDLFVIDEGDIPERAGPVTLTEDTPLRLREIEMNGARHTPVFTSVERISAVVPREVGFVGMKGRDLLGMLREKHVVINPGADYGKLLTPQEICAIVDGSIFEPQARPQYSGQTILLGEPADYPHHIVEPLKRYFATRSEVKQAYVAQVQIKDAGEVPHALIGLVVSGNWDTIQEETGLVIREVVRQGELVDLTQFRLGDTGLIASYFQRHGKPFYRRKLFGLF